MDHTYRYGHIVSDRLSSIVQDDDIKVQAPSNK